MKYYYEDRLIGVGVVDLLPHGLSSVYYFYDPSFKKYRLGVFSSLIEIEYARWLQLSFPEFKYYYMGFYIQNNKKMSYKGKNYNIQLTMNLFKFCVLSHITSFPLLHPSNSTLKRSLKSKLILSGLLLKRQPR